MVIFLSTKLKNFNIRKKKMKSQMNIWVFDLIQKGMTTSSFTKTSLKSFKINFQIDEFLVNILVSVFSLMRECHILCCFF